MECMEDIVMDFIRNMVGAHFDFPAYYGYLNLL